MTSTTTDKPTTEEESVTTEKNKPLGTVTIKEAALLLDTSQMSPAAVREHIEYIANTTGFTATRYSTEDPNKMLYEGKIDNSLLTLDRMPVDSRLISMETWRKMRDIISSVQEAEKEAEQK